MWMPARLSVRRAGGPVRPTFLHSVRLISTAEEASIDTHTHKLPRVGPTKSKPPSPSSPGSSTSASSSSTPLMSTEARRLLQSSARESSLIPETLASMTSDVDFQTAAAELRRFGQAALTKEERRRRQRALTHLGLPSFNERVAAATGVAAAEASNTRSTDASATSSSCSSSSPSSTPVPTPSSFPSSPSPLRRRATEILQVNVGLYCNQACGHCHVESSPKRTELMSAEVVDRCLRLLRRSPAVHTLDLTGGAPELCPGFRPLVLGAKEAGKKVVDRCNLTALLEPDQSDTASFLAENGVEVVASLPCYSAKNVNLQRGKGVFDKSIAALTILNDLGYGRPGTGLVLNLVYNPLGGFLPPEQNALREKYKEELWREFGIVFNDLFCITNMPIKRFVDFLRRRGELDSYMELLVRNFNEATLDHLMCRNLVSVNYDGTLFDCDFNQQLALEMSGGGGERGGKRPTVFDVDDLEEFTGREIRTENHCYGCTAGRGSS